MENILKIIQIKVPIFPIVSYKIFDGLHIESY
jgi:hypothetical protein